MRARLDRLRDLLSTSFWFLPILMLFAAGALALFLIAIDQRYDPGIHSSLDWAYSGGPEGARSLLSTIAGSMITAASVTFSLASVALSIASQQYGSRVLRNFMRDKITQVLLGTFVATFLYSVLVVRCIRGTSISGGFVPAISVTGAIALSLASLVLLVYFIHHVSASIQASRILSVIAADMAQAMSDNIPRLYPAQSGQPTALDPDTLTRTLAALHQRGSLTLPAQSAGYLQSIDLDTLLALATREAVVLEVPVQPGDHLIPGDTLVCILGVGDSTNSASQSTPTQLPTNALDRIHKAFYLGGERTPLQDIRFQFQQLTDVVVRALSPGINDPFTAINGIDELTTGLALFATHAPAQPAATQAFSPASGRAHRQDAKGDLRLLLAIPTLGELLDQSIGHIAIYGAGDRFVTAALRRALAAASRHAHTPADDQTIAALHADLTHREHSLTP
jgi:uncharacterized membrane protein